MENTNSQNDGHDRDSRPVRAEPVPVRTRWTPTPDQVLMLESIFNSGTVNPSKNETVTIRKVLEEFGPASDNNVFYWFQNRRSRSRRRLRQTMQQVDHNNSVIRNDDGDCGDHQRTLSPAALQAAQSDPIHGKFYSSSDPCNNNLVGSDCNNLDHSLFNMGSSSTSFSGDYGSISNNHDRNLTFPGDIYHRNCNNCHPGLGQELHNHQNQVFGYDGAYNDLHFYQSGTMTVFINGVATDIEIGSPLNINDMFGGDHVLFDSSGTPLQVNEHGFLLQGLEHGRSYFLVPRHS